MEMQKLFQVLVIGGAMLSGPTLLAQDMSIAENEVVAEDAELLPIFCTQPDACVVKEGKKVVKDGFECCWGTSCE